MGVFVCGDKDAHNRSVGQAMHQHSATVFPAPQATVLEPRISAMMQQHQFEQLIRALDSNRTFFDPGQFPWIAAVESHWKAIRGELDVLLACTDALPGFEEIQVEQARLSTDRRWKIFPLMAYGRRQSSNERRCPETVRALSLIPGLRTAMFSILEAGKQLQPHRGPFAGVLRYHLGLKIPQPRTRCGLIVGNDRAHWQEGRSLVFDDSHLHSAWNHSGEQRVVLFVDFCRPLPAHLASINDHFIEQIAASEFIGGAQARWTEWEAKHGAHLDEQIERRRRRR